MNIGLTPKQIEFVERAIASGQYASAKEVLAQVWAIGMKEVEIQIVRETELKRLRDIREQDLAQMLQAEDASAIEAQATEFVNEMEKIRQRSKYLRDCFGGLLK